MSLRDAGRPGHRGRGHSPRKGSSARPIVPGPLPMSRASMTVTTHAPAASSPTAIHGTASWRGGSACTGRAAEAGSETSAMAGSAFVPEIGDEAVGPGEISAPGAVIAHELIAAHRQSTRDLGMRRAVVPFNKEAHMALPAAGSGPLRGRSPIFRLVAPPPQARKPICEKIRPGTVPGNRSSIKQRATAPAVPSPGRRHLLRSVRARVSVAGTVGEASGKAAPTV